MYLDKEINKFINGFIIKNEYRDVHTPLFFRLENHEEEVKLISLLEEKPHLQVLDTIQNQLADLVKCANPSIVFSEKTIDDAIDQYLGGRDVMKFGVWVYYPWLEKVVHMLDEAEYVMVRTNRNKHKITHQEQELLTQKKIGVIGLSVGQSVSLALAIERGCGELRIADFDVLDLTNLNRIRSGVHNIDLKKTVIVAREIAEIDPFLKVTCFHAGITEENIDSFLLEGGKLNLLIDECDSIDIKISCRVKAKEYQIPVLMEGSDRCTIDMERFDLEPDREILHGFVSHLDISKLKYLKTAEEKMPYMAPISGLETLSPRMKASALEIRHTINTWPQLASAVIYGGGITADLSRKILLGQLHVSGRYFIDMDELISDNKEKSGVDLTQQLPLWTSDTIQNYLKAHFPDPKISSNPIIDESSISELIAAANKAPSGGNNQPWRWHYHQGTLHLFMEKNVAGAYLDPEYISSYISLGGAIQNLLLKGAELGLKTDWKFTPELTPDHIALFNFKPEQTTSSAEKKLALQIDNRHTNRKLGNKEPISEQELLELTDAIAAVDGAKITWITDDRHKEKLGEISGQTDLLRMFIPEAHADFITREMRWTQAQIEQSEDGIGINTLDLSGGDQLGLKLMKDERAVAILDQINGGTIFKTLATKQFLSSSAVGLLTMPENSPLNFLKGGMAAENLWLRAAEMGYQIHPINVPIIFFYKEEFQSQNHLSSIHALQIQALHQEFKELFHITSNLAEIFLFRIFKAEDSERRTIRKSLPKTLSFGDQ